MCLSTARFVRVHTFDVFVFYSSTYIIFNSFIFFFFFFQAEDGIRDAQESRGLGDVYKRQAGKCVAWRVQTRAPLMRVGYTVCHSGDRASKDNAYVRGNPVVEFNRGVESFHDFRFPNESLEIDLERLATKEAPLLQKYTNPGGLSVYLRLRYEMHGDVLSIESENIRLVGSTMHKRRLALELPIGQENVLTPPSKLINVSTPDAPTAPQPSHSVRQPLVSVPGANGEFLPEPGTSPTEEISYQPHPGLRFDFDGDDACFSVWDGDDDMGLRPASSAINESSDDIARAMDLCFDEENFHENFVNTLLA
eukprot:TRINITY_DN63462_c0_g1_i1.p1 TRINITY_DN63462_c0_g1~~TRINITY_DN63462_c0_g1_i1.p1  ORF type:complete len:308 (+),score=68.51 TRINITY_DN63462_c0_g1_i1:44-967(+)